MMSPIVPVPELVGRIRDGQKLAVPSEFSGFYSGIAMEATREIVRQGRRNLHLVVLPTTGLQADLLIGAGCIATLEASSVFAGEYGVPPRFAAAFRAGSIRMLEATCPALHAGFQAGEKGVPFMPLRGVIGSDVIQLRPDWKVVPNPMAADGGDPILLLPAIVPDWTLFHAPLADRFGNVWYGRRRELAVMAHAARGTIVTVEKLVEGNLMEDEALSCATLPNLYVDAVSVVPRGAWPWSFGQDYDEDRAAVKEYLRLAATEEGFQRYLEQHVFQRAAQGQPA